MVDWCGDQSGVGHAVGQMGDDSQGIDGVHKEALLASHEFVSDVIDCDTLCFDTAGARSPGFLR